MTEPGQAVEVHGAVAVNGAVAKDQEGLVAQIEQTREDLARTIDSLAERVSPAHNVRVLRERVVEQLTRRDVQLGAAAVGVAALGLLILRSWAKNRHKS